MGTLCDEDVKTLDVHVERCRSEECALKMASSAPGINASGYLDNSG